MLYLTTKYYVLTQGIHPSEKIPYVTFLNTLKSKLNDLLRTQLSKLEFR